MKGLRAIIFDLYGTLIDNYRTEQYRQTLRQMAQVMQLDAEEFAQTWKDSIRDRLTGKHGSTTADIEASLRILGEKRSPEQIREAARIRLQLSREMLASRPRSAEILQELRAAGLRLALISDCTAEIPELWPGSSLAPLFEHVEFSCVRGYCKPDERLWSKCLAALRLDPHQCCYIGDGGGRELSSSLGIGMSAIQLIHLKEATGGFMGQDRELADCPQISCIEELPAALRLLDP